MAWQHVARVADVQENIPLSIIFDGKSLAVYRVGGNFYALEDICPHAYALLSSGFVDGDIVECPLHQARFHIPTGKCLGPPAETDLTTFPIKVEGNDILIAVQQEIE